MSKSSIISQFGNFIFRLMFLFLILATAVYFLLPYGVKSYLEQAYDIHADELDIGWSEARAKNLRYDSLQIKSLKAKYSLLSLLAGHIHTLLVDEVVVSPRVDPSEATLWPDTVSMLQTSPLSIAQLKVTQITLTLPASDFFPDSLVLMGNIQGTLQGDDTDINLSSVIQPSAHTAGGHLNGVVKLEKMKIEISLNEIRLEDIPTAYNLKVIIEQHDGSLPLFTAAITDHNHDPLLKAEGLLKTTESGQLTFNMPGITLNNTILPLTIFNTDQVKSITAYSAKLSGQGSLTWDAGTIMPKGVIEVKDASLSAGTIDVKGLRFSVPLEEVWPKLKARQGIYISSIHSPVANLSDVVMTLSAIDENLILEKFSADIWGGQIALSKLHLFPLPKTQEVTLHLKHLNLKPLIEHFEINNLKADGLLNGVIPFMLYGDTSVSIDNGLIESTQKGAISYEWPAALQSDNSNLNLTAKALRNFTYDTAKLLIQKERHKEPKLTLDIKGKNPTLLEGRPFEIRVNITGKILEALESTIQTFQGDLSELRKEAEDKKE